jgi:PAS domain S-box-containing protein
LDAQGQVQFIIQSVQDITAHRLAEQRLRDSQAREHAAVVETERSRAELQGAFQEAPVAMGLMRGPDFVVEWANPRMGQMWGRPVGQVVGRPHFEALPDLAGQGFEQVFADVLTTGRTAALQEARVHIQQDQQPYAGYFNITYQPLYDGPDRITGILCSAVEVTDQVRARQQVELLIQELEARVADRTRDLDAARAEAEAERHTLRALIAEAPAVIARMRGPQHVMELANEQFRRLLGGRELAGRPFREALPDLENQPFFDQIDAVYRTGQSFSGKEVPVQLDRTNSGQLTLDYFNYVYQATRDSRGQVDGILMFAEEVTEQVLARQEREAQRRQLQAVFAQAPVAVCVFQGEDYVLDIVNPPMGQMLGRPLSALVGRPFFDALPELRDQGLAALLDQVRRTGVPFVAREQEIALAHHAPGSPGYYDFVYQPLLADDGASGIVCVATDITDQVRARRVVEVSERLAQAQAAELATANAQLLRTNEDLDNFVYTASHDLKAPISNLESLLTSLRQELPAPAPGSEVAFLLELMQDSMTRFTHTLDLLTDVTKLQHAFSEGPATVQLAPLIEAVRLDLAPLLARVGGRLHLDVAATPTVRFSEKNLRSIVHNLLSNAFKYHDPARPAAVTVRSRAEGPYLVLEVQDNGLGLDLESEHQLFGLFRRYHTPVEGSGVGLHMVKKLVENGGGRIDVASTLGQGSTFSVYLPC